MKWGETLEKWLGKNSQNREERRSEGRGELRIRKVCDDLGEEVDHETLEMLMENGLRNDEIEEVVKATNILTCDIIGDLDIEVEKMFAEGILHKYGFQGVEQFTVELGQFRERHHAK